MTVNNILKVLAVFIVITLWVAINSDFNQGAIYTGLAVGSVVLFAVLRGGFR
jgi:multisubunit Na+/H+ antiporter MnhE subunit